MSNVQKRTRANGKTSYRVRVKYRGRALSSTHRDRRSAERWAAEKGAQIRDDAHFPDAVGRRRALSDLIDRYLEHVLPQKRDHRNQKRQLMWWRGKLGALPVKNVTRALIAQHRDELLTAGAEGQRACGPATTVRYLAALSHVFTVAMKDWEWAEVNPVTAVRKPKEPRGRVRYLDDDERTRLLQACRTSKSPDLYAFVLIALSTGMRRGEIAALEWRDIDLCRLVVTLRETKNGMQRALPIRGPVIEVLAARAKLRRLDIQVVFPGKNPRTPIDLTTPWQTAVRRARIEHICFHGLRHSAASYLAMNGASMLELGTILGHKSTQMTKRYAHLSVEHLGAVLERTNAKVLGHV